MPPATRPRRLTRKGVLVQQALLWCWHADVAQLVEHHLAKVRVAGSNPVVRSIKVQFRSHLRMVTPPQMTRSYTK